MNILDQLDDQPAGVPPGGQVVPSPFQEAIFRAASSTEDNLLIEAVAGSGKTTTIIETTHRLGSSSLFLAFNKAIAEDIARRGPSGDVKTLNALGHGIVLRNRRAAKLNARKVPELVKKIMGDSNEQREWGYALARVVGLGKNLCLGLAAEPAAEDFEAIIDDFGFDIPADFRQDASVICREAFEQSRLDEATFDFDDQLWLPVRNDWEFPGYSNVLVDEAQDLSPIQHEMLRRLDARTIAVGDRHQAIYGFRGAHHNSMDLLKEQFSMRELPLSVSYRCAQSVVLAAREFCPEILWRDGAPEGEISWAMSDPGLFTSRYMILCRNNAPLFRAILAKIRAKEPCQVLSSFLDSFQSFIRHFKTKFTTDLQAKLDHWLEREREACKSRGKLATLTDKYQTAKMLAGEFKLTEDIIFLLNRLKDSRSGPIFATIHKAKGLEHEHVYILKPELLGGFGDLTEEQAQQEQNLHYVAITRAKETLTYGTKR